LALSLRAFADLALVGGICPAVVGRRRSRPPRPQAAAPTAHMPTHRHRPQHPTPTPRSLGLARAHHLHSKWHSLDVSPVTITLVPRHFTPMHDLTRTGHSAINYRARAIALYAALYGVRRAGSGRVQFRIFRVTAAGRRPWSRARELSGRSRGAASTFGPPEPGERRATGVGPGSTHGVGENPVPAGR